MKNVPSKKEAAERVREKEREILGGALWEWFGKEYGRPLKEAFEKAGEQPLTRRAVEG